MNPIIQLHQEYSHYKLTFKGGSKATIRGEYYIINAFVRCLHLNYLDELTTLKRQDIMNYILRRNKEKNWSARTIKNNLQALYNFFDYCREKNIVKANPVEGIERPKPPKDLPKTIRKEDALRILEWLYFAPFRYQGERERAKAIVAMFIFTGIRLSELVNIRNSDVNLNEKILRINSGKGNKDRLIPMNVRLVGILQEYVKSDLKQKSTAMQFFVKLSGKKGITNATVRSLFLRFKKELKIDVSPHKLRHTFATLMTKNSCNIAALSKMLGHSSIKTTMVYLWLDVDDLRDQIEKHPFGIREDLPHKNHNLVSSGVSWW